MPPTDAKKAIIMLHGRGATAQSMLALIPGLHLGEFSILVPQAERNTWYPHSFLMPREKNEPWLGEALQMLAKIEKELIEDGIPASNIYLAGFSQGACLSLDYAAANAKRYGGIIAFTGGLIGDTIDDRLYEGDFRETPVFIGTSDPDAHVPLSRVKETEKVLKALNAHTHVFVYPGMGHTISREEIDTVNRLFFL